MSWAQLTNRPNNASHRFNNNHINCNNTYYRKSTDNNNNNNNNYRIKTVNNRHNTGKLSTTKVQTTSSKRKHSDVSYVILDSGAFIGRQSFFNNFSQNVIYYMTPAVNHEIRDKQSRQFLDNFPYQIIVKKPDLQSVQYVSKFISKNPNLRSLSKVDRQIIALAHTLELQFEGNKNLSPNKKKETDKAPSSIGDQKQLKKSKTGRVHRQAVPLHDSGLRLSKLKKVIPFHFDDFMTMDKQQYGDKHGKTTSMDMSAASPKIKYNPHIKAKSECNEKDVNDNALQLDDENDAITKSQRSEKRQNVVSAADKEECKQSDHENDSKKLENAETDSGDIEKMILEDLNTTFNETASLISSLSAQSSKHQKQIDAIDKRLAVDKDKNKNSNESQSHPLPPILTPPKSTGFGTLFNGAKGSVFDEIENKAINPLPPLMQQSTAPIKKTVHDAWNGAWLTPDNFKPIPKNDRRKKQKLQNVENVSADSSVAVVTVDIAMQRCMIGMGLRVLTTSNERQYGNNKRNKKGNNGEPIDHIFRCYGCFQYEHNTSRTHCRWCGGRTYQRVAIYKDENGKHHYRYFYRDRFAQKYLDTHSLVPRGSQLVKYNQTNHIKNNQRRNQKRKKKKRTYLGNNTGYRGGSRW